MDISAGISVFLDVILSIPAEMSGKKIIQRNHVTVVTAVVTLECEQSEGEQNNRAGVIMKRYSNDGIQLTSKYKSKPKPSRMSTVVLLDNDRLQAQVQGPKSTELRTNTTPPQL